MAVFGLYIPVISPCDFYLRGSVKHKVVTVRKGNGEIYNRCTALSPLLGVKIVHLLDRANLFKISNLVYGGREILTLLYSSLQRQRRLHSLWRV